MSAEEALCAIGDDVSDDESRSSDAEVEMALLQTDRADAGAVARSDARAIIEGTYPEVLASELVTQLLSIDGMMPGEPRARVLSELHSVALAHARSDAIGVLIAGIASLNLFMQVRA
jgi:hypothetical protein